MNAEILSPYLLKVIVGKYNLSDENETGSKSHLVQEIVMNPEWKYDQDTFDADIAILILEDELTFNSFVRPVCLPSKSSIVVTGTGSVVGWGATSSSERHHASEPFKLEVPAIDGNACYPALPVNWFVAAIRVADFTLSTTTDQSTQSEESFLVGSGVSQEHAR